MVAYTKHDLQFILDGIEVSQTHADQTNSVTTNGNGDQVWTVTDIETSRQILLDLIPNSLEPIGMRTISGELNNLVIGQDQFGATGQFPRLLDPDFRDDGATTGDGSGNPTDGNGSFFGLTNTDYNLPGDVVDSDPRTISNLIVDQTVDNPAALYAALTRAGVEGDDLTAALADIPDAFDTYNDAVAPLQGVVAAQAAAQSALNDAIAEHAGAASSNAAAQSTLSAYDDAVLEANAAVSVLSGASTTSAALAFWLDQGAPAIDPIDEMSLTNAQTAAADALAAANAILDALQSDPNVAAADVADAQAIVDSAQFSNTLLAAIADQLGDGTADAGEVGAAALAAQEAAANFNALMDSIDGLITQLSASRATAQGTADTTAAALAQEVIDLGIAQNAFDAADMALMDAQDALTAAEDALNAELETYGIEATTDGLLPNENTAPDEGLSAPFNSWMTLFGQFFDHGLDLVGKGGNGTVFIPLQPDDPLIAGADGEFGTADDLPPTMRFMPLTRATVNADGILGDDPNTPDIDESLDDQEATNHTSPHVDQNQTYTSHPSHQLFVREYEMTADGPASTGHLIEGRDASGELNGGLATWGDVKAQAAEMLGFELTDAEALEIPLFAVDQYGEFIPGENGLPQLVLSNGTTTILVEGNLLTPVSVAQAELDNPGFEAVPTGISFLLDIAHSAAPVFDEFGNLVPDSDNVAGNPIIPNAMGQNEEYDNELLDAHFIAGDGRANENIGLTAVHHVFHQEHNRLVEHTKAVLVSSVNNIDLGTAGDPTGAQAAIDLLNGYLKTDVTAADVPTDEALLPAFIESLDWDGDRLFQAAKFGTEMQYQHLVFEEFARKVQPLVDLFASYETSIDASIVAEFAHTVYRFGHSMLTETVDMIDTDGNLTEAGLIEAFLNPLGYHQQVDAAGNVSPLADELDPNAAAGAIIRGMTRQVGNEIDEFVTPALRSNLLGLPLDLAAINIARGRETGVPTLNDARRDFFEGTGDTKLKPYDSWVDFALNLKNGGASILNFVASYGQHELITQEQTLEGKRAAALAITTGVDQDILDDTGAVVRTIAAPDDRLDFLNSTNTLGGTTNWSTEESGLNLVDFWIGGLAETIEPFGGMLGSTFNFVFEQQLEDLQDGDRFYYLGRTGGLNFLSQLEQNSFANMIIRNTDIGDTGADHLPGDIFATPAWILEMDQSRQITGLGSTGVDDPGRADPTGDGVSGGELNPFFDLGSNSLVVRENPDGSEGNYLAYTGGDHVVLGGTDENDILIGGIGDDTLWGDGGDDVLEGGDGGDILLGGDGDDIITDIGGPNNLQGQDGNDAIFAGGGESLILAGSGKDFVLQGPDFAETFGGQGDDFIHAGDESNIVFGNEGNDWLEGGGGNNLLVGDNGDPFLSSTAGGHDVFISGQGDDDYDSEGGDDIMEGADGVQRFEGVNGFDWATYHRVSSDTGVDADMLLRAFDETPIPASNVSIMDRFDSVEGLSGSSGTDILRGDNATAFEARLLNNGNDSVLRNFDLIQGLRAGDFDGTFDDNAIFAAGTQEWAGGDIILGAGKSDLIEGRGGNDIIDGDLKLNVRLLVRDDNGDPLATALEMHGQLYAVDANGVPTRDGDGNMNPINVAGHSTLNAAVFDTGPDRINPGNIEIVREIIDDADPMGGDFDTAQFSDVQANYTITVQDDGFIRVSHDSVAGANDGLGADGVDLVRNIERLTFADSAVNLAPGNDLATGAPALLLVQFDDQGNETGTVSLVSPAVGQVLRAAPGDPMDGGVSDLDGIPANTIFTYNWQVEAEPGTNVFVDLELINASGEVGPLTGETITVPVETLGLQIRVKATFVDGNGVIETVFSEPLPPVANDVLQVGTDGPDLLIGTLGDDRIEGLAGDDELIGAAGNDTLVGGPGNDILRGGFGTDIAEFSGPIGNFTFEINAEGDLEVIDSADPLAPEENIVDGIETVRIIDGANTTNIRVSDILAQLAVPGVEAVNAGATGGDDTLVGTADADVIDGGAGDDLIFGLAGDDILTGGTGSNVIDGGMNSAGGDGDVAVFVGAQSDYLFESDADGNLVVLYNGTDPNLIGTEDTLIGIETLRFASGDVPVADIVDGEIIAGTAGTDVLVGTAFDDTITGLAGADEIEGGGGNDIIRAGGGNDIISWRAGDGRDFVNGQGNGAAGDTFEIRGQGGVAETFRIYSLRDATNPQVVDLVARLGPFNNNREIVITTDDGVTGEAVVAELRNVEEIIVGNTPVNPTNAGGADAGDTFVIIGDFSATSLFPNTITIEGTSGDDVINVADFASEHRIVFKSNGGNDTVIGLRPQDEIDALADAKIVDNGDGTHSVVSQRIMFSASDLAELGNLVNGNPSDKAEPHATGIRDLEGTGNNLVNEDYGSANQPFIRLTEARYGPLNEAIGETGNRELNPIFEGLEPRLISDLIGDQEADLSTSAEEVNGFFTAFGQYFDHGLDFLPKGGSGVVHIDGVDTQHGDPAGPNYADLTRGSVDDIVDGIPQHLNQTSPFVDQNQAYGSTELVGQFLRESDGAQGYGAKLLAGVADPSNGEFNLLPTLRELIQHHWDANTIFADPATGLPDQGFKDYYTDLPYKENLAYDPNDPDSEPYISATLVDGNGNIHQELAEYLNADFMESGFTLVGDANPFVNVLDHFVAGDLRANENIALTSMHTVWARNHNYHVDNLVAQGFEGSPEELFQAAKIINEAEYQRIVFDEFADKLIGGIKGSGSHGFDDYDPSVDASISHEFAAAVYRVGHSLINDTVRVIDANGEAQHVRLVDAFLNPTNDNAAILDPHGALPPGFAFEPGYKQLGVNGVLEGIAGQPAEEVDFNIVDAVREDLVRVRADLFSFNVARGREVGLGTLNQVRADLLASNDPYVREAVERSGEDLSPYTSWADFQNRNGLSNTVIAQFIAAYPDLELDTQQAIDDFVAINGDIVDEHGDGTGTVKGIDRVDLWVGGLAEEHINGGVVGSTFWVVLHEQFDRLQEGDRFYYLDRVDDFDFYEQIEEQSFADIVARNTGLEGLPDDIFSADADDDQDNDQDGDGDGDQAQDGDGDGDQAQDGDGDQQGNDDQGPTNPDTVDSAAPIIAIGDDTANALVGNTGGDTLVGNGDADTLLAGDGDNELDGGSGADRLVSGDGADIMFGGDGNDLMMSGAGNDYLFGEAGNDHIMAGDGDDFINGGGGRDVIDAGAGDDTIFAEQNDGNDVINGRSGIDTYDLSAIMSNVHVDLGAGATGVATGIDIGTDQISGIENVIGGYGDDTFIANTSVNVLTGGVGDDIFTFNSVASADGDHITDFQEGDQIDLSGIASNYDFGSGFTLVSGSTFTGSGQLIVREVDGDLLLEGNVDANNDDADFTITISGKSELNSSDFA